MDCTQKDGSFFTVCLIYRSPGSTPENNEELCNFIRQTATLRNDNLLLVGDFNLPSVNWNSETCSNNEEHLSSRFLQAYAEAGLYQHQKEITRFRKGEKPRVLDLVLTNKENMIKDINTEAGLGKSDHMTLWITLNIARPQKTRPARYCFSRTNEDMLKEAFHGI